jgi:hypothetical protein
MDTVSFERKNFFTRLIWLLPIVYFFHILEELNGFTVWVTHTLGGSMTLQPFLLNNAFFMLVNVACCFFAMKIKKPWMTFILFFWISAQEFWNFVFHIYTTVKFETYSPGYFTAIFLYLPVYAYVTYIALRERHLTLGGWLLAFIPSISAMGITVWAGLYHFGEVPLNKLL